MNRILKALSALATSLLLSLSASSAWGVVVTQLGFALDESGSMSSSEYTMMKNGLSSALAALPQDGTVEITVVSFSTNVTTLVSPTVLTAASLGTIQAQIAADSFSGGYTNTAAAIERLRILMTGSTHFAAASHSFINIATDGEPTAGAFCDGFWLFVCIGTYYDDQQAAVRRAQQAAAAGIDTISFEAIGSNSTTNSAMLQIALAGSNGKPGSILPSNPTTIPYPGTETFVAPVTTFSNFASVIEAKVIASVTPVPAPAPSALLAIGLLALGAFARRRVA